MQMPHQVSRELPAIYVADPFAVGAVCCPRCSGEMSIQDIAAHGRGARRTALCPGCGLHVSQETRPIPGRRVA